MDSVVEKRVARKNREKERETGRRMLLADCDGGSSGSSEALSLSLSLLNGTSFSSTINLTQFNSVREFSFQKKKQS